MDRQDLTTPAPAGMSTTETVPAAARVKRFAARQAKIHGDSFWTELQRAFFREDVPFGMALIRILLPLCLLVNLVARWPHVREIYSADGAPAQLATNFGTPAFLPELPGGVAVALFSALLFFMVTTSIGWYTRFSLWATLVLFFYFTMMDCLGTVTKYTVISCHTFLLLALSNCGAVWSVDRWLERRRQLAQGVLGFELRQATAPIWPQRLLQLLIGIIYFGAAITKMHTPAFFSGDQITYWIITKLNAEHPVGEIMSQYPIVLVAAAYITIAWEVVFLFCVWNRFGRWPSLALGVLFHFMTALMLGLYLFPAVMFCTYLSFVTTDSVRWWRNRWRHLQARFAVLRNWLSESVAWQYHRAQAVVAPQRSHVLVGFGLLLAFVSIGAVELEFWLDPYQMRRPSGPLPLQEIADEEIRHLLGPERALRESDKIFTFDLGTHLVGEHLWNRSQKFLQGQMIWAQASLNPPHGDMWVECNLHDADMKLLNRHAQVASRDMFRSNFTYVLDRSFPPGEYYLVLRSNGEDVARRKFTLLPGDPTASAPLKSPTAN